MSAPPPQEQVPSSPPPAYYEPKPSGHPPHNVPPQTEYHPQPPRHPPRQVAATTVITQTAYLGSPSSSRSPVLYKCHVCGTQQMTIVTYEYGGSFWLLFLLLFCLVGIFALFLLCIDDVKDVYHTCPNCNSTVGVCKGGC